MCSQSILASDGPSRRYPKQEGKKPQRSLVNDDMFEAFKQLQSHSEEIWKKANWQLRLPTSSSFGVHIKKKELTIS
jgi:hypothetical protein